MTHYDTLGIEPTAIQEEIVRAYRAKAQRAHPDRNNGDREPFIAIQAAYEVLSDPESRKRYDAGDTRPKRVPQPAEVALEIFRAMIIKQNFAGNYAHAARDVAEARQQELAVNEKLLKAELSRLEKLVGRVTSSAADNIFDDLLLSLLDTARNRLNTIQFQLLEIGEVLSLLDHYTDTAAQLIWPDSGLKAFQHYREF